MRRREFMLLLGGACGAVAWPRAARAQSSERMRRIGVLMAYAESDSEAQAWIAGFREGLRRLGWTEGGNISLDVRWATGEREAIERFAKELVARGPELVLASTTTATAAMLQRSRTIPIVFALVSDPVGSGFVASFARPSGNATGFTTMDPTMAGKWLELLKEIAPRVVRGPGVDVGKVGRELGVRYVLEGSVRRAGNRVRITAPLIEAASTHHLCAARHDRQ